jgi:type III secretion protein V
VSEATSRRALASELGLATVVVLVVAMMVVPLPTPALDFLLVTNLAISLLLLLAALRAPSALSLSSLPTLLLVTTLFRLALNVSSTRLILLQADAGEVIRSFGEFVVQGNYAVGAVVFLVLTLVQYIVIARGSERVAEVAARFALDALPGRQMAIDAELRAGALSAEEARKKRSELSRESSLFGALDGAMKFVKGDAIAGLVILAVNLVGGVVIGVTMRGLDVRTSFETYGLLTIGDGLVTQIPSLLVSTTAGVVVTRVASAEAGASLASEMARQIFGSARTLGLAAVLLGLFAIVPGLPTIPFLTLALLLGGLALYARRRASDEAAARPARVIVSVSADVVPERERARLIAAAVLRVRDDLGVPLPSVRAEAATVPGALTIRIDEIAAATLRIEAGRTIVRGTVAALAARGIPATATTLPRFASIATEDAARAQASGAPTLEGVELVAAVLEAAVVRDARALIGPDEAQLLVDRLAEERPALVRQSMPRPISLSALTEIARGLVAEGVPPRPFASVLEAASRSAGRDPDERLEEIRIALARSITARFAPERRLDVIELDPMIEDALREGLTKTGTTTHLALAPALGRDVVGAIGRAAAPGVVLMAHPELRRHVRKLVERELPQLAVLTGAELEPDVALRVVGRATV